MSTSMNQRYDWIDFEPEPEMTGDGEGDWTKHFLTIRDNGEEMAVIVHRTYGDDYPLDGALAEQKRERARTIVAALNARPVTVWDDDEGLDEASRREVYGDPVSPVKQEWLPLATIDYATDPAIQGTAYRLRHHTLHQTVEVWETGDHYAEFAGLLEDVFDDESVSSTKQDTGLPTPPVTGPWDFEAPGPAGDYGLSDCQFWYIPHLNDECAGPRVGVNPNGVVRCEHHVNHPPEA